ncbi:MAG: ribosome maturation factor RimP [Desulfobacter sp.]|nr:ribosome maturation factor RimP [Desulfobacter sp.]WDP84597.1 MAG: ribosome maturation factor RimP [Desulfobacter sp.]
MGFIRQKDFGGLEDRIYAVAQPLCRAEGLELVHIECVTSNRDKIVRLYMDKSSGVTMNDCVTVSRQLGDLIDVHIEDIGSYRLEVSSPGPNRPLSNKEDFIRFAGQRVRIETHDSVSGQKKFTGILEKTNDDSVVIAVDGKTLEIAAINITKAMLAGQ